MECVVVGERRWALRIRGRTLALPGVGGAVVHRRLLDVLMLFGDTVKSWTLIHHVRVLRPVVRCLRTAKGVWLPISGGSLRRLRGEQSDHTMNVSQKDQLSHKREKTMGMYSPEEDLRTLHAGFEAPE